MIIDIHTHLVNPNLDLANSNKNFAVRLMLKKCNYTNFENYLQFFLKQLTESKLDKSVLIGIENNNFSANNEQVLQICQKYPQYFLYGVNLNPFAHDIEEQIQKAIENKAVLVKILPSYQNIDLLDLKCVPFLELIKKYSLPLLVHTGIEHTLPSKNQNLNNPNKLKLAAKLGVTVICAHCGGRMFLHEKNYFDEWEKLALQYDNVYGDLSAMLNPVQQFNLKKILKCNALKTKVIFGSDYPAFPFMPFSVSSGNTFVDCYTFLEKMGFDDSIFKNSSKVLNL